MGRASWQTVQQIAGRNIGVITAQDAIAAGVTRHQVEALLRSGTLVTMHRGVYRLTAYPRSHRQDALAACLACGPGAVACSVTAAGLWALIEVTPACAVCVAVPAARFVKRPGITVCRTTLRPSDWGEHEGVPLTSPARTLADLAAVVDEHTLEHALDEALRRGLVTVERLQRLVEEPRMEGRRGSRTLCNLLRVRGAGISESVLETAMMQLLRWMSLPQPEHQLEVSTPKGTYRIDLGYADAKLAIELDGDIGHRGPAKSAEDRERQNLLELQGWRFLRFTYKQVVERAWETGFTVASALGLRPGSWRRDRSGLPRRPR